MKRILILAIISIVTISYSFSQNKTSDEANLLYASERYCEAAEKCSDAYKKASNKGPRAKKLKGDLAFKTAECYRLTERVREANEWYDRAILLDYQQVVPEVLLFNADMLRIMAEDEKALLSYQAYQALVPNDARAEIGIQAVQSKKEVKENKTRHIVQNQTNLNKKEYDMAPMFADRKNSKVFFASSRPGSTGDTDPRTCENYMDLWTSDLDPKGNWSEPKLIETGGLINTDDNEGTVCFDGKAKTMFFTRCPNEKKMHLGCDIWFTESKGKDKWETPEKINLKTSDTVSVGHPCVTEDGKFLIFASDMPGGFGGKDLWYTTFDKKAKTWTAPVNMGKEINTRGNELFPTLGEAGQLYFASDGYQGLGGLDIYVAEQVNGENKWENPTHLGFPINSDHNDYALIELTPRKGYFTSERKSENGEGKADIYMYELPPNIFDLKVIVSEAGNKTKKLEDVKVVVKSSTNQTWEGYTNKQGSVFWDKKPSGDRYVNENTSYSIKISKKGFYEDTLGSSFSTVGLNFDQNFVIDMALLPIKPINLPEVRYPLAQWTLLVDSTINSKDSLMFVYNLLQEYPGLVLELSSHTDSRDTDKRNQVLSENRAKMCYKFLVEEKGIDPRRIVPVGKGEAVPRTIYKKGDEYLEKEPTDMTGVEKIVLTEAYINQFKGKDKVLFEKLHQYNRRTEGKVLSMKFDVNSAPANPNYLIFQPIPKR